MCIVFFQLFDDPPSSSALSSAEQAIAERYAFVLASNRDEYFTRPTRRAHMWDPPHEEGEAVLAGRDLLGGGTWLGVTRSGRVAVLTNYRTPGDDAAATAATGGGNGSGDHEDGNGKDGNGKAPAGKKRSRGHLVLEYLHGTNGEAQGPLAYAERVAAEVSFGLLC